jgi:O-antigen/teichoic acid export membrane protein
VYSTLIGRLPAWVRQWVGKGSWAVADQAFFALSQFAMSVLLARWLTPTEYGAYALLYGVFLFIGSLHSSLLTEPMLVFASVRFADRFREYLKTLVLAHFVLTGVAALCLLAAGLLARRSLGPTSAGLMAMGAAQPAILLAWLYRRACYVFGQPAMAASGGALHLVTVLAGVLALRELGVLSVSSAFLVFGAAGLVASSWLAWRLRRREAARTGRERFLTREVLSGHWSYGRWSVMTGLISWGSYNLYFFLLPAFAGLSATGAFKALLNVVMPATHAMTALSFILLPMLSRQRERGAFRNQVRRSLLVFLAGCSGYGLFAGAFWEPLLRLLYGPTYVAYVGQLRSPGFLWLIAFLPVAAGVVAVLSGALRALERSDRVFKAYVVSGVVGAVLGVAAVAGLGLEGAIVGTVLYTCVTSLTLYRHLRAELADWSAASREAPAMPVASAVR